MKRRVTGSSAATSEATKFSSMPSPMTTGQPSRASTMHSGSVSTIDRERIGAVQFGDGLAHRLEQIGGVRQMMVNAMRDDLGVGLRAEAVAQLVESGAQRLVIFDDAVVHDGDAVARHVRMGIARGRNAVGGPAGVRDADVPGDRLPPRARPARALTLPTVRTRASCPCGVSTRKSGRIVAAILQPAQSFHEDGDGIALRDHADDSAHN